MLDWLRVSFGIRAFTFFLNVKVLRLYQAAVLRRRTFWGFNLGLVYGSDLLYQPSC